MTWTKTTSTSPYASQVLNSFLHALSANTLPSSLTQMVDKLVQDTTVPPVVQLTVLMEVALAWEKAQQTAPYTTTA